MTITSPVIDSDFDPPDACSRAVFLASHQSGRLVSKGYLRGIRRLGSLRQDSARRISGENIWATPAGIFFGDDSRYWFDFLREEMLL